MAVKKTTSDKKDTKGKGKLGKCRDCALSYDYHERTAYPPHELFLCKCPHEQWSQFLDKECVNGKFKGKNEQARL